MCKASNPKLKRERIDAALTALAPCGKTVSRALAEKLYDELVGLESNRMLWTRHPEHIILVRQLVFCLMVPGGKASKSMEAVDFLDKSGLAMDMLNNPCPDPELAMYWDFLWTSQVRSRVRFPRQKEKRVLLALQNYSKLVDIVRAGSGDPAVLHKRLIKEVKGFGPKACAHFMRNTGLQVMGGVFLPIVDTHVIKFVYTAAPQSAASTPRQYGERYIRYCKRFNADPLLLDALLWSAYAGVEKTEALDFGGHK